MFAFFQCVSKICLGDIITMQHSVEFTYRLCFDPLQPPVDKQSWWRHQMETFSASLAICVRGEFTGPWWIPCTKAGDAELWCFLWSAPEKNLWVNNRETGDLRRHRAHFDVLVMATWCSAVKKNGMHRLHHVYRWHDFMPPIFPTNIRKNEWL